MSYDLLFQRALSLHDAGDLAAAEQIYRQILETAPNQPDVLNLLGLIAQSRGIDQEAVNFFYQAIRHAPQEKASYYFNLGVSLANWHKPYEAAEAFQKVIALAPDVKETYVQLANLYRDQNQPEQARRCYEQALDKDPHYYEAKVRLALLDTPEKAEMTLKQLSARHPDEPLAFYHLANLCRQRQDATGAEAYAQRALELAPDNADINLLLAEICLQKGNPEQAQPFLLQTLQSDPDNLSALINRANFLSAQNEEEAERLYLRATELDKNNFDACLNYATLLQKQNRLPEALETFRRAVLINPQSAEACNNLGLILKDTGDYTEALGLLFNAYKYNPALEEISLNITETLILLHRSGKIEEAQKIAANWAEQNPQNIYATHINAVFKGENIAPDKIFTQKFFDHFADTYELVLQNVGYQLPRNFRNLAGDVKGTIVDLGCGSGLVGEALKSPQNQIIGVDLSPEMLKRTQNKGVYASLVSRDITDYLQTELPADTALITAADVFCYFGSLDDIIRLCAPHRLIFSVETSSGTPDYQLAETGRYKHNPLYINNILTKYGYADIKQTPLTLRTEDGQAVEGVIFTAR